MLLLASYFITLSSLPDLGFCLECLPSPPGSLNSPTRPFLIIPNLHVTCSSVSVQSGHRSEGSPGRPANWRACLRSQPAPQPHSSARTWVGRSLAWRSRQDAATCPVSLLNPRPHPTLCLGGRRRPGGGCCCCREHTEPLPDGSGSRGARSAFVKRQARNP